MAALVLLCCGTTVREYCDICQSPTLFPVTVVTVFGLGGPESEVNDTDVAINKVFN